MSSDSVIRLPVRRTKRFKEDYVMENMLLKMRIHQLEAELSAYKARSFWPRVLNMTPTTKEVKV